MVIATPSRAALKGNTYVIENGLAVLIVMGSPCSIAK